MLSQEGKEARGKRSNGRGFSNKIRRNDEITCICAKKILLLQANTNFNLNTNITHSATGIYSLGADRENLT